MKHIGTMHHDDTFRFVLIAGAVLVLPFATYFRLKSNATGEPLDRRQEGLFILVTLRPVAAAGMLGLLAYMIDPRWMAWSSLQLPLWLRWTGVGVGVLAGGLLIWTMATLGKNLTDTVVTRRQHTLVTTGPYRWVRHPFYDALVLSVLANSLVAANWFIFACGLLVFCLIVLRTSKEEENLLARFGDSYRELMARTGRFLPRL